MFRSYDHLQAEIYALGFTRLTTDPFSFNMLNTIVIGLIVGRFVDVAAVVDAILRNVFILVYNFGCRQLCVGSAVFRSYDHLQAGIYLEHAQTRLVSTGTTSNV
jgi:hypothetical protein